MICRTKKKSRAGVFFLLLLTIFLMLGKSKPVFAASKCNVTYADSRGKVSAQKYKDWAETVKRGGYVTLPRVKDSADYCYYWVIKEGEKIIRYNPGAKYQVKKDVTFCLRRYRFYNISFFKSNGQKKYADICRRAVKETYITLPSVPGERNARGLGWATSQNSKDYLKPGTKVKVTGNMKFYAVRQKSTSVTLCWPNGKVYKRIYTSEDKTRVFPAADVNNREGDMVLGWSRRKGKTSNPEYYAGDRIPGKTGKYYMVVFQKTMDQKPPVLPKPEGYAHVYMIGDSRTVAVGNAVGIDKPDNLTFVAKSGGGIQWFRKYGYKILIRELEKQPRRSKKAVVMNWGANDLRRPSEYPRFMTKVARKLSKKYNCTMYYMPVNPVNSAMIMNCRGKYLRTEKLVDDFNQMIRRTLCSGKNKCYTYINSYDHFRKKGWISDTKNNSGVHDGTHYSVETSLRIYDYCIRFLNRAR